MNKKIRKQVFDKFNGLCAYSGKPLDDKWQIDHAVSKCEYAYKIFKGHKTLEDINHIDNLFPAIRRINHYKRSMNIDQFRNYISTLHLRLAKLPKKTNVPSTQKRIDYLNDIANLFDIAVDKPFNGVFYFETINK